MGLGEPTWRVMEGDARELDVEDESVHVVVLSVPYWGLRNYGTEPVVWGGTEGCAHEWGPSLSLSGVGNNRNVRGKDERDDTFTIPKFGEVRQGRAGAGAFCSKCGAWRGSLGLEPRLDQWVDNLVSCAQEWRRVLRDDGTLWVNCGDAYASQGGYRDYGSHDGGTGRSYNSGRRLSGEGLKPKDLIGLPWRLAFALQADGWFLRSAICWAKGCDWLPNERIAQEYIKATLDEVREEATGSLFGLSKGLAAALKRAEKAVDRIMTSGPCMPESVTDRTTSSYEMLFMFSKQPRYYFDQTAIRVPGPGYWRKGGTATWTCDGAATHGEGSDSLHQMGNGRNPRSVWLLWRVNTEPQGTFVLPGGEECSHFASFPSRLVRRILLCATSEEGVCGTCGNPWERVERRNSLSPWPERVQAGAGSGSLEHGHNESHGEGMSHDLGVDIQTVAWVPTCTCHGSPVEGRKCSECGKPYIRKPVITGNRKDLHGPTYSRHRTSIPGGQSLVSGTKETIRWEPTCECYGSPIPGPVQCSHCHGTDIESTSQPREVDHFPDDGQRESGKRGIVPNLGENSMVETGGPCPHCLCPDCQGMGQELRSSRSQPSRNVCLNNRPQRDSVRVNGQAVFAPPEPTGNPCSTCHGQGSLGYVEGPIWPDDILESWPRVPATVLDPMAGSGTTGRVALSLGLSCVLNDLNPQYTRLMHARMEAYPDDVPTKKKANGTVEEEEDLLPLFEAMEVSL